MPRSRVLTAVVLVLAAGCSTTEPDAVARSVLRGVNEYQVQVERRIATERRFYVDQTTTLRRLSIGAASTDTNTSPITSSALYGRLITVANRESRICADEMIHTRSPEVLKQLLLQTANGVEADLAVITELTQAERRLAEHFAKNLATLEYAKAQLDVIRKHLTTLLTQPGTVEQLEFLSAFAKETYEHVEAENKKADDSKKN